MFYGRVPPINVNFCNQYNSPIPSNTNCIGGQTATSYVTNLCDKKQSCSVKNDWQQLGPDPCPGVPKYLQIDYQCVTKTTTARTTSTPITSSTTPTTSQTTPTTTKAPPTTSTRLTTRSTTAQTTTTTTSKDWVTLWQKISWMPPGITQTVCSALKAARMFGSEPRHEKTYFLGLRPGKTQTDLLSYRSKLESWNFGYSK